MEKDDVILYVTVTGTPSGPEDEDVPGVYEFSVPVDYAADYRASAVLDTFHANVAVECLDDFDFRVTDVDGNVLVEPDDAQGYARIGKAQFWGKVPHPSGPNP